MNSKILKIFKVINILNDKEINEVISSLLNAKIKVVSDNNIELSLFFKRGISLNIINKLNEYNARLKDNQELEQISINWSLELHFLEINTLSSYILQFLKQNNCSDFLQSWQAIELKIEDDNIQIKYLHDNQLKQWLSIKDKLENYISNELKIEFKKVEFLFDDVLYNHQIKIQEDINKNINSYNNEIQARQIIKSKTDNDLPSINDLVTKISDLDINDRYAVVEGKLFSIKTTKLRNNNLLVVYYLTDDVSSILIKKFCKSTTEIGLEVDMTVRFVIELTLSKFDNEQTLEGKLIRYKVLKNNEETVSLDEPQRIEFNLHSKMSSYDGIVDLNDLAKFLNKNNFKYFALTDRYNVQNYPDLYKKFKNTDITPIYGVELEVLPSKILGVLNPIDQTINNANYVIFDLETTGLYPYFDDVIEFGAIKISNNEIIDKKQFFIKPNRPLKSKISQITNIFESDLENAVDQETGLKQILEFLDDSVLIAHNGIDFDFNFLNTKLWQHNLPLLKNCIIDTMYISRAINKGYKSHSMEMICKKLKIDYDSENAHRALYDTELLWKIWQHFSNELISLGCKNIIDINDTIQSDHLKENTRGQFICVYAKIQNGIHDIYNIVSQSHSTYFFNRPTVTWELINQFRTNLLVTNLCIESDVFNASLSKTDLELNNLVDKYDFISLANPNSFSHEVNNDNVNLNELQQSILRIIKAAKNQDKVIMATSNAYYLTKKDKVFHDLYVNSPTLNKKPHRFARYKTAPMCHYRTTKEMLDEFSFINDEDFVNDIVINNANKLLEIIDKNISPVKHELYPPMIEDVDKKITEKVYENAHKIYGENLPTIVVDRIKKELDSIINHGFAVVYWISHLLVKESIDDGYVVGSRGSVGSSLVATFLNITDVNPLKPHYLCSKCTYSNFDVDKSIEDGFDLPIITCPNCGEMMQGEGHNILFEVFLGFYGDKVPDIDLNFSGLYQNKAHNFIKKMFGEEHTFRAGTISTVAEKTSFTNARNYFELIKKDKTQSELERYASKCVDVKRTTGQHPGGIIVIPKNMSIFDFTPYNYPADDKEQAWFTTHFAFEHIHDNLLKFDILGHDNPTILKMLKDLTGVDEKNIPHYDPKTMEIFNNVGCMNISAEQVFDEQTGAYSIPEFGTKFVREMLNDTKPKTFADLIRISGLSHGTDVWIDNAKDLINHNGYKLSDIIACRDDIMTYLINHNIEPKLAFNIMEDVRKGKQIKTEYIPILLEANVPQWYIDSCNKIKYMFPKAHATAYVMHAWKFAWYKLNFPLEYYSTYFSIRANVFNVKLLCSSVEEIKKEYEDINNRIRKKLTVSTKEKDLLPIYEIAIEMMARGYKFKMININKSHASEFIVDKQDNALICPFTTIDGLGSSVADSIIQARNFKKFNSIDDFIQRTKISKQHITIMNDLKILDDLNETSQLSIF